MSATLPGAASLGPESSILLTSGAADGVDPFNDAAGIGTDAPMPAFARLLAAAQRAGDAVQTTVAGPVGEVNEPVDPQARPAMVDRDPAAQTAQPGMPLADSSVMTVDGRRIAPARTASVQTSAGENSIDDPMVRNGSVAHAPDVATPAAIGAPMLAQRHADARPAQAIGQAPGTAENPRSTAGRDAPVMLRGGVATRVDHAAPRPAAPAPGAQAASFTGGAGIASPSLPSSSAPVPAAPTTASDPLAAALPAARVDPGSTGEPAVRATADAPAGADPATGRSALAMAVQTAAQSASVASQRLPLQPVPSKVEGSAIGKAEGKTITAARVEAPVATVAIDAPRALPTTDGAAPTSLPAERAPATMPVDASLPPNLASGTERAMERPVSTAPPLPLAPGTLSLAALDAPAAFADSVRWAMDGDIRAARIELSPQALGELSIEMAEQDGKLSISVHSAVAATRELLESLAPRLREHLLDQGHGEVSIDVEDDSGSEAGEHRSDERFATDGEDAGTAAGQQHGERASAQSPDAESPSIAVERAHANRTSLSSLVAGALSAPGSTRLLDAWV